MKPAIFREKLDALCSEALSAEYTNKTYMYAYLGLLDLAKRLMEDSYLEGKKSEAKEDRSEAG